MSAALKCNRCKRCFDVEQKTSGPWVSIRRLTITDADRYERGQFIDIFEDIDLCPYCADEYMAWYNDPKAIVNAAGRVNTELQDDPGEPETEQGKIKLEDVIMNDLADFKTFLEELIVGDTDGDKT